MTNNLAVQLNRDSIEIDRDVFFALLSSTPVSALKVYKDAIAKKRISLTNLKSISEKEEIPYPLFFAPIDKVTLQLKNKERVLYEKVPAKDVVQLNARGSLDRNQISLIIKDLSRKQEFLKKRIITKMVDNTFIGLISKDVNDHKTNIFLAGTIRNYLEIDLEELRDLSKPKVLKYIVYKAEQKGVLVSFSSHNFMPKNIPSEADFSGICIKDKKFPYVFINTRDGDEKPKILESDGRQVFTLLAMLVAIAMNKFVLNTKNQDKYGRGILKQVYSIAGEIIIPIHELCGFNVSNLDDLEKYSKVFKVTPSMLLFRLKLAGRIGKDLNDILRSQLLSKIESANTSHGHAPLPETGYGKYNGQFFSREVVKAYKGGRLSQIDVNNVLFRKGKHTTTLLHDYCNAFK